MKQIVCELCGSTDFIKQDSMFVCQFCNTKYTVEEARKLMIEGTVRIDRSEETQKLYIAARNARKASDNSTALKHYEKISAQDPNSWEALFYLSILKSDTVKNGELASFALSIQNCLERVFQLLKEHVTDETEKKEAVKEIIEQCNETTAFLVAGSQGFYHLNAGIHGTTMLVGVGGLVAGTAGTLGALSEHKARCKIIVSIMGICGDSIEAHFDMNDPVYRDYAIWSWNKVLEMNEAFKTANKSEIDNNLIFTYSSKIQKHDPNTKNADNRTIEIVYTASIGSAQLLQVSVDDSEMYKVWNGKNYCLSVLGPEHKLSTHNPMMKRTCSIKVPKGGLRIKIHGKATSFDITSEPLNPQADDQETSYTAPITNEEIYSAFDTTDSEVNNDTYDDPFAGIEIPDIDNDSAPSSEPQYEVANQPEPQVFHKEASITPEKEPQRVVTNQAKPHNSSTKAAANSKQSSSVAITAFILSLAGLLFPVCAIIGLILAIANIKKPNLPNKGLIIAALIISICFLALSIIIHLVPFLFWLGILVII